MEDQVLNETQPKRKGKGVIIVLLALFLAGSIGSNIWLWKKEQNSTALASSKIDSLNYYSVLKDSLYAKIAEEELKVHNLRTEIAIYQNDNDSLKLLLEEKLAKINSLKAMVASGGSPSKLRALKDSLSRLSMENNDFKTKVQTLLMENDDYKAKMLEHERLIAELQDNKKILTEKVNVAAQPSVGPIIVVPTYEKKGIYVPIYKAKKVARLQISFDVLGNKLTEKSSEKEYIVRIIDPNGIVLSNNNKMLSNSDDVYTAKESVTFNGVQQKIKINYTQTPDFKKGKYKVELKEGSEVKQTSEFELL
ncbi:MAG TPA: hypothetical protein VGF79_09820 [Bacteroidia bacterium]